MRLQYTHLRDRLAANLDTTGVCHVWTGARTKAGYGELSWHGKVITVHRAMWELHHGPIPQGLYVCHDCPGGDNPACANPDHLFLGTAGDNSRDMVAKGRHGSHLHPETRSGANHWTAKHPELIRSGERSARAKLSAADVAAIKTRYRAGETNQSALARDYGVTPQAVNRILRGRAWRDDNGWTRDGAQGRHESRLGCVP